MYKNSNMNKKSIIKNINNKILKKFNFKKVLIVTICLFLILLINNVMYGADPTLVTKLNSALKKIQDYFVKISAPAAGVAIAVGVMMRKFSFGDEEKMRIGKKIIFNAVICYGIIISTDLIIKFVDSVL